MNKDSKLILILLLVASATSVGVFYTGILRSQTMNIGGNWVAEELKITNVDFNSNTIATLTIKNFASKPSTINSVWINGQLELGNNYTALTTIPKDTSAKLTVIIKDGSQFSLGEEYQFKLITAKGTIFDYNAIYNSTT